MDQLQMHMLKKVADLHAVPEGAYNIRDNGNLAGRNTTAHIDIVTKKDKPGIDIIVKPGTKNESVHIPVIVSQSGLKDLVYNDFYIGEDADVVIVAGCGIHCGGEGTGGRILNPTTIIHMDENGYMEMETTQIKGVDSTIRDTKADLKDGATLIIKEKIMTHEKQYAETNFQVDLDGAGSTADVVSRSVAKGKSSQIFNSKICGNNQCYGHTECDAILMEEGHVNAVPSLEANHLDASLIHEAAIGKIAGEQIIKLMTLGLTEEEAEEQIVNGFLK